jgi:biopolymer transport protein TolQ
MMRESGSNHRELGEAFDAAFAVSRCEIDYLKPALLDDLLTVETRVLAVGAAVIRLDQQVHRGEELLARLRLRIACVAAWAGPRACPSRCASPSPMYAFPRSSFADGPDCPRPRRPPRWNPACCRAACRAAAGPGSSVVSLFLQADTIVKLVMVLLLLASFWTWAIIFDKALRLRRLRNQAKQFEEAFWSGGSLEVLFDRLETKAPDPMSAIFVAAMREWRRSAAKGLAATENMRMSLQERIERVMDITLGREIDHLERHMTFSPRSALRTLLGSSARSGHHEQLRLIAASKNTTLAVVAPGTPKPCSPPPWAWSRPFPPLAYNKLGRSAASAPPEAFAGSSAPSSPPARGEGQMAGFCRRGSRTGARRRSRRAKPRPMRSTSRRWST